MKHGPQILDNYRDHRNEIVAILEQGCVIAGDSDTVPGLLAPLTADGFQSLNLIKGRFEKPYLVLVDSPAKLFHFIQEPLAPEIQKLVAGCWPGPLTIVFKARKDLPDFVQSPNGTIAIRIPNHPGLLAILSHFDGLFSTSANLAGQPVPATIDDLDPNITRSVQCIVRDAHQKSDLPSTIIDGTQLPVHVIREGAFSIAALEKIIGMNIKKAA